MKIVGFEGGGWPDRGITHAAPAYATDKALINPVFKGPGGHMSIEKLDLLVQEGNVGLLPQPREIDEKYMHQPARLLICQKYVKVLKPTDYVDHWVDEPSRWVFTLMLDAQWDTYVEQACADLVARIRVQKNQQRRKILLHNGLILNAHHPVLNALYVKEAPPDRLEAWDCIHRACLRGGEAEYEKELSISK